MNTIKRIAGLFACYMILCVACSTSPHFITDDDYRAEVLRTFAEKRSLFVDTSLFAVFDNPMTLREREAMQFLYAYMPVGDVADYDGTFYLNQVRASFAAQTEMPWGKQIPEAIFRHFVLPVRVNNENLDESRRAFFDELKARVSHLPLREAVLEVNHWCHEKVVYMPSDARTSSPLATVKTAHGRCGEESTFTVAALRAVGIPARQVYTPRWAHTDDNHAWVEAWVDGKWYFMGACEPEPVLNLAWFNAPAFRSMLMHTNVFGLYQGDEEVMEITGCYTEINVTANYAPVAPMTVVVVDAQNRPVADALVEFKLYNYAEFYTVARKATDAQGCCSLSAGKGDMLVWATRNDRFGYGKASFGATEQITITLNNDPDDAVTESFDMIPPVAGSIPAEVSDAQKAANARRLTEEDDIRKAYIATFYTEDKAVALAEKLSLDKDEIKAYLLGSRGNWQEIEAFLLETPQAKRTQALMLLNRITTKDLRDTPASVLSDHLNHTPSIAQHLCSNAEAQHFHADYVLNPRVSNEFLTPYKQFFGTYIDRTLQQEAHEKPEVWVDWVRTHIAICDSLNPQRIPVMPAGVWKARMADTFSRNIFFVATARSMGIPARLEPVTQKAQYYNRQWIDVNFDSAQQGTPPKGCVAASLRVPDMLDNPKYYSHFTIAKIHSDGQLHTLNFETDADTDMGVGGTWANILKNPLPLDEGCYLLVSGMRMASGKVLTHIASFAVKANETTTTSLLVRDDVDDVKVIGSMDAEALFRTVAEAQTTSILNTTGRGYFVVGILGAKQEPTNHAMRSIAAFKNDFEQWGRSMILLFKNDSEWQHFDKNEFGELPSTVTYGIDIDNDIAEMIAASTKLSDTDLLPVFVIADTFGRVVFVSQGYVIGLGEQMLKTIRKL